MLNKGVEIAITDIYSTDILLGTFIKEYTDYISVSIKGNGGCYPSTIHKHDLHSKRITVFVDGKNVNGEFKYAKEMPKTKRLVKAKGDKHFDSEDMFITSRCLPKYVFR